MTIPWQSQSKKKGSHKPKWRNNLSIPFNSLCNHILKWKYSLSGVHSCSMNYFCIDCVVCMLETFFTLHNCSEHLEYCNLNPIVFLWCLKETQIILFFPHNLFYYGNPMCLFRTKRFKSTALWHCVSITLKNRSLVQENILTNN